MNEIASSPTPETAPPTGPLPSQPVVFFDGVCGLCNHFVDFVITRDRGGNILFAPLQGSTARRVLNRGDDAPLDSVVLYRDGRTFEKSAAVVRVLLLLGGVWSLLGGLFWLIPLPLRDVGYTIVARLRYRLFGKKEVCRMPTPDERDRFLD